MPEPPKILIVDDVPLNVALLEQLLQELGYQTVSASNGQEALQVVAAEFPDLVLLDIMMPVMDGYAVLERLQANPETRDLPVIVISALHDLSDVVKGIERGAEDYLPKPFDPVLLAARVSASLDKKRLRDIERRYRRVLERELEIGHEIQSSFLPGRLPAPPGWELDARFHAQRQVAGDLYDAFLLPRAGRLCLVVGDVSGKGVGAALYMTLFRTLLRVLLLQSDTVPGKDDGDRLTETLRLINQYVAHTHGETNMFASLFVALLDPLSGAVTYVNAGHNPPLLLGAGGTYQTLAGTSMVVGLVAEASFRAARFAMAPGDTLLVYTDGVTEASNGCEYGEQRLAALATRSPASVRALLDSIEDDLFEFIGTAERADDITLLAVQRLIG